MRDAVSFDRVHVFVYVLNIYLYIVNKGYSYGKLVKDQHLLYKISAQGRVQYNYEHEEDKSKL